jgi:carboxylesterase
MMGAGSVLLAGVAVAALLAGLVARRKASVHRFESADAARRPRDANGVVVGAAELRLEGTSPHAVLVLHGFNDSPQSMAYLAQRLNAVGYSVHVPRLPGHGCALPVMAREQRAPAWRDAVRNAYAALAATHERVFVCGQSMGGALAVLHAVEMMSRASSATVPPTERDAARSPAAMVLLAPFLGMPRVLQWKRRAALLLSPIAPYQRSTGGERSIHDPVARAQALGPGVVTAATLRALEEVALQAEHALPELATPTLYIQSRHDNRITESAALAHFAAIGATDKRQQWLTGSGHILSADYERDTVADAVQAWFAAHATSRA